VSEQDRIEAELLHELEALRHRVAELEALEAERQQDRETIQELLSKVERAKQEWEATVDSLQDLVCLVDHQGRIIRANRRVESWGLGQVTDVAGRGFHELLHPHCTAPSCYLSGLWESAWDETDRERPCQCEVYDKVLNRHVLVSVRPCRKEGEKAIAAGSAVVIVSDITERKQAEEERERLIAELQEALDNVKTLRGLIPIRANCKKIRDDEGYWHQVEVYVRDHTEAQFTHGLCPDCFRKLYPWYKPDEE